MNNWSAPQRPNIYAEQSLIAAILDGTFPPGSTLPGERQLAADLGVTRPTLREAIQRLARDGWLLVRQGKPTLVNNFWRDGGLNVLGALTQHSQHLPPNFVTQLLEVRLQLAPAYTRAAIAREAAEIAAFLAGYTSLPDAPVSFATFDWELQRRLTITSGNPIYTLILNGFADFYVELAQVYFATAEARERSRHFYAHLLAAAEARDAAAAERLSREAMHESIALWQQAKAERKEQLHETLERMGR